MGNYCEVHAPNGATGAQASAGGSPKKGSWSGEEARRNLPRDFRLETWITVLRTELLHP